MDVNYIPKKPKNLSYTHFFTNIRHLLKQSQSINFYEFIYYNAKHENYINIHIFTPICFRHSQCTYIGEEHVITITSFFILFPQLLRYEKILHTPINQI